MPNKYFLEITVFLCGAIVMIYELVGSRVLAPYLGTSIFVWTSLIGVILGSLSLGYWLGGRLADKKPSLEVFSSIILISALLIGLMVITKDLVLISFQKIISLEVASLLSALVLFSPASILLGMISPYAVKLKIDNLNRSGRTVGNLYAISTTGSIFGTFLAGFYLIPSMGTTKILITLALTLTLVAIFIYPRKILKTKCFLVFIFLSLLFIQDYVDYLQKQSGQIEVETKYSHATIFKGVDAKTKRKTLNLKFDPFATQSAIFLDGEDGLVFDYTKFYRLAKHFKPDLKKSLIIGGAAYTYPRDYLKQYPQAELDVVEIDKKLTALARKYFRLADNPRLKIYHEDGRTFLNRTTKRYDVIFGDAFQSLYSIPYQLTTQEAVAKMNAALNDDGVVIVNIISAINGSKGEFLRAEYATYKNIFPQVYLFPVGQEKSETTQNLILVALKSTKRPAFTSSDSELDGYLGHLWKKTVEADLPILTDDFAPVDYYIRKTI